MSALDRALGILTPGEVLRRLAAHLGKPAPRLEGSESAGRCCDFRDGHEEKNASLSYSSGDGGPIFHLFSGDNAQGGALAFLESAGIPKGEAVQLLIEWAGLQDEPPKPGEVKKARTLSPVDRRGAEVERMRGKLGKLRPLATDAHAKALQGWQRIEVGEDSPEALEVARRGLMPALTAGVLVAYRWVGNWKTEAGQSRTRTLSRHIRPGALAFEVPGPDGTVWAIKARNPGSKEDLKAADTQRYVYVTAGQSSPAWVRRLLSGAGTGLRFFILEGELNAAAVFLMLQAAGAADWEIQGVASAVALPHVDHIPAGAQVYLYADADEEGQKAREKWGQLLAAQGCEVFQVATGAAASPFAVPGHLDADACDALGEAGGDAAGLGQKVLAAVEAAQPWHDVPAKEETPAEEVQGQPGDVWETKRRGYGIRGGKLCALTIKKDEETGEDYEAAEVLADFTARIVAEVIEEDGSGDPRRVFHIEGHRPDGSPLYPPLIEVPTSDFSGMNWAVAKWGGAARIPSGQGKKDKARDAVQVLSNARGYPFQTVYQHTGWIQGPGGWLYLTGGAVIGADGGVGGLAVSLPGRLAAYALPDPAKAKADEIQQAVRASLDLLNLAPDSVGVPLLGAAYRSVLGPSDFVVWTVGETGKHKTAFTGLVMAHFGPKWGRKFLPDGWNSSANFLEVNAFRVKDALFVIDDFKPSGNAAERAKLDGVASRVIQGAADGAGRGTLTADRRSRAGLWPRGTVATSAEDLPRGHSNRARLMVVEVHDRLIKNAALSTAYFDGEAKGGAGVYALALAAYVQALAGHFDQHQVGSPHHAQRVRQLAPHFQGAHGRTGDAAAEVAYGWETFLSFAVGAGALSEGEALTLWGRVVTALQDTAQSQGAHLAEADPVGRAVSILSELLAQGRVYLADKDTGGQPDTLSTPDMLACGWQVHRYRGPDGEEESYRIKPGADLLGYVSDIGGQLWAHFLPDALHKALQDVARGQGGAALPDPSKLWGNLRDKLHGAGLMRCNTEGGYVRATAKAKTPEGNMRQFITLVLPIDSISNFIGNLGNFGNQIDLIPSDTSLTGFPTFSLSSLGIGNLGNRVASIESLSSPDSVQAEGWTVEI